MSIGRATKYMDQFGFLVNLNFNKKGELVKIKISGVVSLLISIILLEYSGLKLNIMF